jgi:hypothetical protein
MCGTPFPVYHVWGAGVLWSYLVPLSFVPGAVWCSISCMRCTLQCTDRGATYNLQHASGCCTVLPMYVIFSMCTILFKYEVLHICGAPCARCTMCGCTKCATPMPNVCRAEFVRCTLFSLKYMVCQDFLYATCALCHEYGVVYHFDEKPCMDMGMCKGGVCVHLCLWRVPCLRCVT